jgi:hypothetical protein
MTMPSPELTLQVFVPVLLLIWQGLRRERRAALWLAKTMLIGSYLGLAVVMGVWMIVPRWGGVLFMAVWAVLAALSWRAQRGVEVTPFTLALGSAVGLRPRHGRPRGLDHRRRCQPVGAQGEAVLRPISPS